jgi:hypothetical protein
MNFPKESLDMAKQIADQYRIRRETSLGRMDMLYNRAFLHIDYGFDDAIKSGKTMLFLHEVKSSCDCDSYAGILYLIAKELGLKPKIYSAYGLRDVKLGESVDDAFSANHTFITTQLGKDTHVVDPFLGIYGKTKIDGNKMTVVFDDHGHKEHTERVCNMLNEMSEEEYLQRFYKTREEGGREALSIGRAVHSLRRRMTLEYLTELEQLASYISFSIEGTVIEKGYSQNRTLCLKAPVSKEGKWHTDNGELYIFTSSSVGWTLDQFENVHNEVRMPYSLAKAYVKNLHAAVSHFGRKSTPYYIRTHNLKKYFSDRGFSETGDILKPNGLDKTQHDKLNKEIFKYLPSDVPSHILPHVSQLAVFHSRRNKARTSNPKWPHIYSPTEHINFIEEYTNLVQGDMHTRANLVFQDIMAKAGFIPNANKWDQALQRHIHGENPIINFRQLLLNRKKSTDLFDMDVDLAMFQKEHPAGTITATSEELDYFYRRKMFTDMITVSLIDRSLEVKDKRKGLERLLASNK